MLLKKVLKSTAKIKPSVSTITPEPDRRRQFDVLVVGAGPAGSTAAYTMAKAGLDVALFERAAPGEKTAGGTAIYTLPTREILPDLLETAPLERILTDYRYMALTADSAVTAAFKSARYAQSPFNRVSVHRAKFDKWLAAKAVDAGAVLFANHKVETLLKEHDKIIGLEVGPPVNKQFFAGVVILAEGVNALLAERAGLVPGIKTENVALYVKETMALPGRLIEERFNLQPGLICSPCGRQLK